MPDITSPPVRYPGGKWRIASWIYERFPPHVVYCEPYCGGASVLFRKPPSEYEVINDLDGDVVNFFRVLRKQPDELISQIELTPYARQEYKLAYEPAEEPVERARRFLIRYRQSFGSGNIEAPTGWRFQRSSARGKSVIDEWNEVDHLWAAAGRLKQVMIECEEALQVIDRYDSPFTLFYVDPPYVQSSRVRQNKYPHEMTDADHRRLAEVLNNVRGMVALSGYQSALYDELYAGWQMVDKTTTTNGNNQAVECLWMNPAFSDVSRLPLFDWAE